MKAQLLAKSPQIYSKFCAWKCSIHVARRTASSLLKIEYVVRLYHKIINNLHHHHSGSSQKVSEAQPLKNIARQYLVSPPRIMPEPRSLRQRHINKRHVPLILCVDARYIVETIRPCSHMTRPRTDATEKARVGHRALDTWLSVQPPM